MPNQTPPEFFARYQKEIDTTLKSLIDAKADSAARLHEAMQYSTLLGGKRIRPILVLATAKALGVDTGTALNAACSVELIHAYSLVHDDLPAMDDDALRRGQATCHIAFDEATAILTGDGLQALAFEVLSQTHEQLSAAQQLKMLQTLSYAAGARGMVAGQAIDLASVDRTLSLDELEGMHRLKTGALIDASVRLGALCQRSVSEDELQLLSRYAKAIGLGFQVQDDILDLTSDTETLGKTQGADVALNKPTYPSLMGLEQAQSKLKELNQEALIALEALGQKDTSELEAIANYIVQRVF